MNSKMAPEVSKYFGFSLKHGTIVIGVVESILAFMAMVLCAAYADNPHELIDMSDPNIVPDLSVLRTILISLAVISGVKCIFDILLIFGAETNRPILLLPWLISKPILGVMYVLCTIIAMIHHSDANQGFFVGGHLLMASIIISIATYNFVAVFSFFKHLKSLNF